MGFPILVRWHLFIESGPRMIFALCIFAFNSTSRIVVQKVIWHWIHSTNSNNYMSHIVWLEILEAVYMHSYCVTFSIGRLLKLSVFSSNWLINSCSGHHMIVYIYIYIDIVLRLVKSKYFCIHVLDIVIYTKGNALGLNMSIKHAQGAKSAFVQCPRNSMPPSNLGVGFTPAIDQTETCSIFQVEMIHSC